MENDKSINNDSNQINEIQFDINDLLWLHESENINNNVPYSPFYGDVTELNTERTIIDIVGKETLAVIVSDLTDLLETSVAVYEKTAIMLLECSIRLGAN